MIDPERLAEVKAMLKPQADLLEHFEGANLPKEQTEISTTVTIPFYGDKLIAIAVDGEYMVPVKPIAERLGLDWEGQRQRIKRDSELWAASRLLKVPSGRGGPRETICLPLPHLKGWMFSVDVARCNPDAKAMSLSEYSSGLYGAIRNHRDAARKNPLMIAGK